MISTDNPYVVHMSQVTFSANVLYKKRIERVVDSLPRFFHSHQKDIFSSPTDVFGSHQMMRKTERIIKLSTADSPISKSGGTNTSLFHQKLGRISMKSVFWSIATFMNVILCTCFVLLAPSSEAFSSQVRLVTPTRGIWPQSKIYSSVDRGLPLRVKNVLHMSDTAVSSSGDDESTKKGIWGKIKAIVPPANERQKLVPLALMFFCILFSYTILRDTKDVLMITAPKSGAEVIPFIKTYVNLPVAIVRCLLRRANSLMSNLLTIVVFC